MTGPIIRVTSRDLAAKHADLAVTHMGVDPEAAVEAMREAGEIEGRQYAQLRSGTLPLTIPLPGIYYDQDSPIVKVMRRYGVQFQITTYPIDCPVAYRDDMHFCTGQCSTVQFVEIVR